MLSLVWSDVMEHLSVNHSVKPQGRAFSLQQDKHLQQTKINIKIYI